MEVVTMLVEHCWLIGYAFLILGSWVLYARLLSVLRKRHKELYSNLAPTSPQVMDFDATSTRLSSFIWSFRFLQIKDIEVRIYCWLLVLATIAALVIFVFMLF